MSNFGINFAAFVGGAAQGYNLASKWEYESERTALLKGEREKREKTAAIGKDFAREAGLPEGQDKKEKSWFRELGDNWNEFWSRMAGNPPSAPQPGTAAAPGAQAPAGAAPAPSGETRGAIDVGRVADVREPNYAGGPSGTGGVPPSGASSFGVAPDQTEVAEGTSRSAFGYSPRSALPVAGGGMQGSSGGVAPPGVSAQPSAEALALAETAVRRSGGNPTPTPAPPPGPYGASQNIPGQGVGFQPNAPAPVVGGRGPDAAGETPLPPVGTSGRDWAAGSPTQRPMVGTEPPPDRAQFVPQINPATDPRAARGETRGAIPVGRVADVRQSAEVIQFPPQRPRGAIPTPADQRAEAEAVRIANTPMPAGQRPQDLTKAVTAGQPPGTLPTSEAYKLYREKYLARLMAVDPEAAARADVAMLNALRQGASHNMTLAQAAFEQGDVKGAAGYMMIAFNNYLPIGEKAQFEEKGGKLYMTRFNEKTGEKIDAKPMQITAEQLGKIGNAFADPRGYGQWIQWQSQFDETKRAHRASEGAQAARLAQAERHYQEQRAESRFRWTVEQGRLTRQEDRADETQKLQKRAADRADEAERRKQEDFDRKEAARQAFEKGEGSYRDYLSPTERKQVYRDVADAVDTSMPKGTTEAQKGTVQSIANDIADYNSKLSAKTVADVAAKIASGKSKTTIIGEEGDYLRAEVDGIKVAIPKTVMGRYIQPKQGAAPGAPTGAPPAPGGAPPARGGEQGALPVTQAPAAPRTASALPTAAPRTLEELSARGQQQRQATEDQRADMLRNRQSARSTPEGNMRASMPALDASVNAIRDRFPPDQWNEGARIEAARLAAALGLPQQDIHVMIMQQLARQHRPTTERAIGTR